MYGGVATMQWRDTLLRKAGVESVPALVDAGADHAVACHFAGKLPRDAEHGLTLKT